MDSMLVTQTWKHGICPLKAFQTIREVNPEPNQLLISPGIKSVSLRHVFSMQEPPRKSRSTDRLGHGRGGVPGGGDGFELRPSTGVKVPAAWKAAEGSEATRTVPAKARRCERGRHVE